MNYKPYQPSTFNPEDNRPGCLDFLKYASLHNGKQTAHTEPKSMCVGTLKDNKDHTR